MMSEQTKQKIRLAERAVSMQTLTLSQQEDIQAALTILLGSETEYHTRVRAARRLARQGADILPLVLTTLSTYPEITAPTWPWWPLQYEQCSHLLIYLGQKAHMQLVDMLQHPALTQPIGPVLWISIIEATSLLPYEELEMLLRQGLTLPWDTVRYAAAMALSARTRSGSLQPATLAQLRTHLHEGEKLPVRLAAAYALLNSNDSIGVEVLLQMMSEDTPEEVRKAVTFILATESPFSLHNNQYERMVSGLIGLLRDASSEVALHAAQALGKIAEPTVLDVLGRMLFSEHTRTQIMILTALEEMASHKSMREALRQKGLPSHILPLLGSPNAEIRRQASYTIAVCGGEYVTAVLGTITHIEEHPGHLEAIESLRMLYGALKMPERPRIVRWLIQLLSHPEENTRGTALDSLVHLLWQTRLRGRKQIWKHTGTNQKTVPTDVLLQLMNDPEPWIRQRAIELIGLLGSATSLDALRECLLQLLYGDKDSGVRASAAYTCGQLGEPWAVPALIEILQDQNEHVALTALHALDNLAVPEDSGIRSAIAALLQEHKKTQQSESLLVQEARKLLKKLQRTARQRASGKVA